MKIHFKAYGEGTPHLIILHGLLGSGRNWHTIASRLADRGHLLVPDMRNHGQSPHAENHRLADMVTDIVELQQAQRASPAIVVGHSMGGLVAMDLAFQAPEQVQALVVVDIVPRPHRANVALVLETMADIPLAQMRSKQEIDAALAGRIESPAVRQFVLTNVRRAGERFGWRVNVPALLEFLRESQAYRPAPVQRYEGPVLFIRGEHSPYVAEADFALIRHYFPRVRIETIPGAGHWVHHDAPEATLQVLEAFIDSVHK